MANIQPITLPDANIVAGVKARVFLAECRSPAYSDYTATATKTTMQWMNVVLQNRIVNYRPFGATGPNLLAVVRARGQFAGFQGYPVLSTSVENNINAILAIANNTADRRSPSYLEHVQLAIDVANAATIANPSPGKLTFWRTAGSSAPGGSAKFFRRYNHHDYYYM
jgi:hypothetical protein